MSALIQVALPLPVDQTYTYKIPAELQDEVKIGCRVVVPFGPRILTGVAVEVPAQAPSVRLKAIQDVLDPEPAFSLEMLNLTRWMADYYLCSWGEVLRAALPAGIKVESQRLIYRGTRSQESILLNKDVRQLLEELPEQEGVPLNKIQNAIRSPLTMSRLRRLETEGWVRIETEIVPPRIRIKKANFVRLTNTYRTPMAAEKVQQELRGEKQTAVVRTLIRMLVGGEREPSQKEVLESAQAASSTLKSLERKGVIDIFQKEVIRTPLGDLTLEAGPAPQHTLHDAQIQALDQILENIRHETFHTFLLHGITGSGKTEVYINALKEVLERGKTGIILVPEIALTPQTVQRFRAHLGDQVAVLHSRMSQGERYDVWRQLHTGRYKVVIGPRSAILAPLQNLGLIVVDEEHESSYKQFDPAPRYHARDVAVMRAFMNKAVCVLGSATPSIESYINTEWNKYTRLVMPRRVPLPGKKTAQLPVVSLVDLSLEKKKHQLEGSLSLRLQAAIKQRLERQEQVILLQNRRGYAPVVECQTCGWTPSCKDCAVTLTYHKTRTHLRCHYCGYAQRTPKTCPKCYEQDLNLHGQGTQRVEEELQARFPEARILRMDLDTTGRKDAHRKILDQFGQRQADILVGTQMIAKGLDFKRVTLVGVINADTGLLMPDFRSSERTFQLLMQVAGRAGRDELRGEVILQTRNPAHAVIRFAYNHDYLGFIESELPERKIFAYPPFGRMIGLEFKGPNLETVVKVAEASTAIIRTQLPVNIEILGPVPAFIQKIKKHYRYHTILKIPRQQDYADVKVLLRQALKKYGSPPKDHRTIIDVDPVGLF